MSLATLKLRINFGTRQFIVNCNDLTYDRAVELADKVAAIRMKSSLLSQFPMEEGETREKWLERIEPLTDKDRQRKDGESVDDHLKRLFDGKIRSHNAAFEITNAIAETFNLPAVSKEDFKTANWLMVKSFLYDVLNLSDISADEFEPKKPSA